MTSCPGQRAETGADHPRPAPADVGRPVVPSIYDCVISHTRRSPLRYRLRHRTYLWLVDLDELPRLPWPMTLLACFRACDHFAGTDATLRGGLERFLTAHGVPLDGGRVLMLAHARVFGHVFNPLTLYWCHDASGVLVCVVAEVHNTYGERHCYLLRPDVHGRARVAKDFYVSPFFPVDGAYEMRLPEPGERLALSVLLRRPGVPVFTATVHGRRRPATSGQLLLAALRRPWSTAAVSAAIRLHGVRLYLRGLKVRPRPRHHKQEGMK